MNTPLDFVDQPDNGLFSIKICTCPACENVRRAQSENVTDAFVDIMVYNYSPQYIEQISYSSQADDLDATVRLLAEENVNARTS